MKRKGIVLFVCVFLITDLIASCGGGGGGDTTPAPQTWSGPVNSSGFPDVAGTYALTTSSIKYTCTDGSSGTSPAVSLNLVVTQSQNTLSMAQSGFSVPAGMTIVSSSPVTGTVEKNGDFITIQTMVVTMSGISGNVSLSYNLDGTFTPSSWSGTYTYSAYLVNYNGSCTYTTPFSGAKL